MQETTVKEQVLKKIRQSLIYKSRNNYPDIDMESNVFEHADESIAISFARNYTGLSGEFLYCHNKFDFLECFYELSETRGWKDIFCWEPELKDLLEDTGINFVGNESDFTDIKIGMSSCEGLIARTGSIMVSSRQNSRRLTIFPEIHLVVAFTSQLVMEIKDGLQLMKKRYGAQNLPSMISFISGPSRTADIEKTLVLGAHGPKELYVFLIEDSY